jgi:glyceraldehyde 3-phosphate dehydrogenase
MKIDYFQQKNNIMIRIGVNGFGRIGRYFTRLALLRDDMEIVAVNDLADIKTLAHLLKYDSIHGQLKLKFTIQDNAIHFSNGRKIVFFSQRNPADIPWDTENVDFVLESTGLFRSPEKASVHIKGSVKKVLISAPAQGDDVRTIVIGVNDQKLTQEDLIVSNASCTTNSAAPLIAVLKKLCVIESAYITTVHSYTSDQQLHDAPHSDLRRARGAAQSIVPTSTGAAKAISSIFPELEGKIGGCGIRVPVPDGSLTDLTLIVDKAPSVDEINTAFKEASETYLKGILEYTSDPIVSVDIIGNPHSCIYDEELTSVIGDKMIKVVGWYDNEAGYSNRLIDVMLKF